MSKSYISIKRKMFGKLLSYLHPSIQEIHQSEREGMNAICADDNLGVSPLYE
jgi:hypothetical protein